MTDKLRNNMHRETILFLLVAIIMGNSLMTAALDQTIITTDESGLNNPEPTEQSSLPEKPVLQPKETVPVTGNYVLNDTAGKPCIKVSMGGVYIVIVKTKAFYFNLDPSTTLATGRCGQKEAVLLLAIVGEGGYLELTFEKEGNISYVSKVKANLAPSKGNKNYPGVIEHEKLFPTAADHSLKCNSQTEFHLAENLRVKLGPLQFQAFKLTNGKFGEEVECWADFNKRIFPIIIGATVVGLLLIAVLTFLIIWNSRRQAGYDRI
ncbi:lysosome-associated membrane glycoprotein 3-like [Salvelinus namaycush]|uniref:Lysosome-associated membrane glycoprotein 3-like n=1 Tax=Salvelinus namaycush TaxID=8040 RepID=A0A8U1BIP2_SALNM|nr:lysosome-associated membrane glycoprotein 3-like [Salvelinus namaycush]XP_038857857.1 lysosome-associated membrane glycoprotein 3-like [Salvelinus namaycush]